MFGDSERWERRKRTKQHNSRTAAFDFGDSEVTRVTSRLRHHTFRERAVLRSPNASLSGGGGASRSEECLGVARTSL